MTNPADTDGIIHRAMRNLGLLVGGKSISGVFGLLYLALAVRTLGMENYGQLVLIHAFTLAVATIVKFQTWQPVLRYGTPALQDGRLGDFQRLIRFTAGLDIASSVVGAVMAAAGIWLLGPWVGLTADAVPLASLYSVSLLFMITATSNGILRLFDRFDLLPLEDNIEAFIRFAGALLLFLVGGTLTDFLVVWFASTIASGVTCAALAWREVQRRGVWPKSKTVHTGSLTEGFDGLWKFVWATNANSSMSLLTNHVATLVVGALIGPAEAALFRIARQIAEAMAKPVKLLTSAIYPELARLVADDRIDLLRALTRRAFRMSCAGAGGSFLILLAVGSWLLAVVGGQQAVAAYGAMLQLGGAALTSVATFTLEPTLISLGRPTLALGIQLASAVVYLPALVALTQLAGIEGAGGAALVAAIFTAILQYLAVRSWFRNRNAAMASEL